MGSQQSGAKITKKSKFVDLSDQGIETFPLIPKDNNIQTLILTRNCLKELPVPLPKLRVLNLSYNWNPRFPPAYVDAFLSYKKLETLDLTGNLLEEYPEFVCQMKELKILILFYNRLSSANSMKSKDGLTTVNIGHNSFLSIPELPKTVTSLTYDFNILNHFNLIQPKLTFLSLSLVGLNSIDQSLKFPKLETLILSRNNLTTLPDLSSFAPNLEKLDISDNFFSYFPRPPSTIEEYIIRSNKLTEIPDIIADFHQLSILDVSDNRIKYIPQLPDTIEEFVFSQNCVTKVKRCYTPQLKRLWFKENFLTEYPDYDSSQVKDVTAPLNKISEIDPDLFNDGIFRIDYSGNQIKTVPSEVFKLAHLTTIFLNNNNIRSLPNSITNARVLNLLDITNNPIKELPTLPLTLINLYVGYCNIRSFGSALNLCQKLQILDAPGNQLTEIPNLPSLRHLILSRNNFTQFPSNISAKIISIDFSCNKISYLPDSFVFANLDELDLCNNTITNFPSTFNCPKLKFLKLNLNNIKRELDPALFKNLEIFDIANSGLSFKSEPEVRQFFVSEKLPQYSSRHVKKVTLFPWLYFSEMKGVRDEMEDSICVNCLIAKDVDVYAIFDGHGGSKTSAFGSMYISDAFRAEIAKFTLKYLYLTIKKLDRLVHRRNFGDGSTMSAVVFNGRRLLSAHIGDSRCLVVDKEGKVTFTTNDHKATTRTEFERIHKEGGRVENNRVHGILAPSRTLGDVLVPGNTAEPEMHSYDVTEDDKWLIIGCDGVFDVLSNEAIGEIAAKAVDAISLATDLRNLAYANISLDNITVVAVEIQKRKEFVKGKFENDDEKMIDTTDDESLPVEDVHMSFNLTDVDNSLYQTNHQFVLMRDSPIKLQTPQSIDENDQKVKRNDENDGNEIKLKGGKNVENNETNRNQTENGEEEVALSPLAAQCGREIDLELIETTGTVNKTEEEGIQLTAGEEWRYANSYVAKNYTSPRKERKKEKREKSTL